ncbi:MAG: cell cycle transcriptional regulator TrcR [Dongiaceae bacterium]
MPQPLMPKATAVWLVENTTLSFQQIADFCGLHPLEIQGIADGEVAIGIVGLDPTTNGQLTKEEIVRCEADRAARLVMAKHDIPLPAPRTKGPRYTPVSKRQDKPDAVAWLVRHHPELSDAQISKLIGTTKQTIAAVRDRTHWNSPNLRPRDPVLLGLCSQSDLNSTVLKARRALEKTTGGRPAEPAEEPAPPAPAKPTLPGGFDISAFMPKPAQK